MNLANQIFCHLCCTPLRPVDYLVVYLKRERPLNNQLQPLTSKTDKKLLEIFCERQFEQRKTGAHSQISGCALRFVLLVPILRFLRGRWRNKQRICPSKSSPAGNFPVPLILSFTCVQSPQESHNPHSDAACVRCTMACVHTADNTQSLRGQRLRGKHQQTHRQKRSCDGLKMPYPP